MIFNLELGRLYWNTVRDYLRQQQFNGAEVKWIELSGWIDRTFTVNAPAYVARDLQRFAAQCSSPSDGNEHVWTSHIGGRDE
jgi:hypothetical protein